MVDKIQPYKIQHKKFKRIKRYKVYNIWNRKKKSMMVQKV